MKIKQFAMLLFVAVFAFAFNSCSNDEDVEVPVELSADLSGKWIDSEPGWSMTYQFNADHSLIATEVIDEDDINDINTSESGTWEISDDDILTLCINWGPDPFGNSMDNYYIFRIVERTNKKMVLLVVSDYSTDEYRTLIRQ